MEFWSTAEMVRHYCNELLEDGQAHSVSELYKYVSWQTGGRDINGGVLPRQSVTNEIRNLDCEKTRRGIYKKRVDVSEYKMSAQEQVFKMVSHILEGAIHRLKTCKINVIDYPLSSEEAEMLSEKGQKIASLLEEAKKIAQSLAPVELDQTEAPGPIPPPPDQGTGTAIERDDGADEQEKLLPMSVAL